MQEIRFYKTMMTNLLLTIAIITICALPVTANQKITSVFYLGGGQGTLVAPVHVSAYRGTQFGFSGGVGISVNERFEVIGRVSFDKFLIGDQYNWRSFPEYYGSSRYNLGWNILTFGLDFKYPFKLSRKASLFLVHGAGVAIRMTNEDSFSSYVIVGSYDGTKPYFTTGAGVDFMVTSMVGVWIETRVVAVLTDGESIVSLPVKAGVKLAFGCK